MVVVGPMVASGQQPSASQVQQALQQQPGLADMVRGRIAQSGLTPDQIRARLSASGYPATLLDPYLSESAGSTPLVPGSQELAALQALGLPALANPALRYDTGFVRSVRSSEGPSEVFGVDVFQRTTTQFLPLLSGPVPPDYNLGPGDNLVLILTGDVELTYSLPVTREGFVLIPQVGQVHVANLTLDQLRDVLYTRLGRVYSGVRRSANATTRFDVTVANVRANQVYVVGEVSRRLGKNVATLDLYDYLLRGDTRADVRLETGDVIFVPIHESRVRVNGAVLRPAIYETKSAETLADVIMASGGFRPDAALERVKILRILPASERSTQSTARQAINVPLPSPISRSDSGRREMGEVRSVMVPPFVLQDGDIIQVDSLEAAADQYTVAITGMVQQPGTYPWRPGLTLRQLMTLARGPKIGADLRAAEIAKLPADRSKGQLATTVRVPLDSTYLFARDAAGRYIGPPGVPFPARGTAADVPLEPYDNVLIFRQPDFELQRTVTITGEVLYPGSYALKAKDDRLADLVERAGGLTPRAYAEGIRFIRPADNRGRINIDLPKALKDRSSRDNVILQPGDSIRIPEYQPSVRVTGAVNSPGSVLYRRGAGLDYYLSAAGGFTRAAERGQVSVHYANGEVRTRRHSLFFSSNPSPGPGSEVFVPAKDANAPHTDTVALFGAIAQILASTVAIIVIASRK